jgi:hypothetical protein
MAGGGTGTDAAERPARGANVPGKGGAAAISAGDAGTAPDISAAPRSTTGAAIGAAIAKGEGAGNSGIRDAGGSTGAAAGGGLTRANTGGGVGDSTGTGGIAWENSCELMVDTSDGLGGAGGTAAGAVQAAAAGKAAGGSTGGLGAAAGSPANAIASAASN